MDWLSWLFLESPTALALALGVLLFGLLAYWRRGGSPRPLLIGLAVSVTLLAVQYVVDTHREIAVRILTRIERDVEAGRTAALAAALAGTFRSLDLDRAAFINFTRVQLERIRIRSAERGETHIAESASDLFVASVGYQATIDARDWGSGFVPSRWRITFGRTPNGWRIITIDPPQIAGTQLADWRINP